MDKLLDAFGIDWKLLIAQAINFGVLIVALWFFLYKPVLKVLSDRKKLVADGVLAAEEAKAKLSGADDEVSARLHQADTEATTVVNNARTEAKSEREKLVKAAEDRASAIERDAQARAQEASAKALRDSEKEVARLAILAAGKILSEKK